jgi:restriction system-associated AAA family ATPase
LAEGHKIIDQYYETVTLFKNCATSCFENENKIMLDFWVNDDTKQAFKENFVGGIFHLFQAFQILYTFNYRSISQTVKSSIYQSKGYYTHGKLPMPGPEEKVFYFLDYYIEKEIKGTKQTFPLLLKQLSDGEQQFIHSLGICLMLRNRSSLLLLDEPETHFNPEWRSKFIRTLKKSLEASQTNNMMMDLLVTSHSPFIISDCYPDKVIVFEKGEQPVNARDMNFRTYGTSVDIIMENIFKKRNTIGDLSRKEIEDIQIEVANKKKLTPKQVHKYKMRTQHLGDSIEKILLFARLNELEDKNA